MLHLPFIACALALLVGGWALARLSGLKRAEWLLAATAGAVIQVAGSTLLIGMASRLESTWLVGVNVAWSLALIGLVAVTGRLGPPRIASPLRRLVRLASATLKHPLAAIVTLGVAAELLFCVLAVAVLPPYSWDEVWYHLPTAAHWVQSGGFDHNPFQLFSNAYPANAQLAFTWLMLAEQGDTWVQLAQVAFAAVGGVATAVLARQLGTSVGGAIAAGGLFIGTPIVFAQATTANVDIILAASFLLSLALAARWAGALWHGGTRRRRAWLLGLAGVMAGMTAGTKPAGVVWASAIGLFVAGHLIARAHAVRTFRWRAALALVCAFAASAAPLGTFWYVRNLVHEGNPLAPIEVAVGDFVVFDGSIRTDQILSDGYSTLEGVHGAELVLRSWLHEPTRTSSEQRLGGLGLQWPALMLPALLVGTSILAWRRRWPELAILGVVVLAFLGQPSRWWTRFTIPIVAPGAALLVMAVENARRRTVSLVLTAATLAAVAWSGYLAVPRISLRGPDGYSPSALVDLRTLPAADRALATLVVPNWFDWVADVPTGGTIGVAAPGIFPPFYYALYGEDLSHRVVALHESGAPDPRGLDAVVAGTSRTSAGTIIEPSAPLGFELLTARGDLRVFTPQR